LDTSADELVNLTILATEISDVVASTQYELSPHVAPFDDPVQQLVANLKKRDVQASIDATGDAAQLPFTGAGSLKESQTGKPITDRQLELRLQQVGMDAMAKRHADRVMAAYRDISQELAFDFQTHLEYLSLAVKLNPWSESAWTALSTLSPGRTFEREES
jgi:hypothetical protein